MYMSVGEQRMESIQYRIVDSTTWARLVQNTVEVSPDHVGRRQLAIQTAKSKMSSTPLVDVKELILGVRVNAGTHLMPLDWSGTNGIKWAKSGQNDHLPPSYICHPNSKYEKNAIFNPIFNPKIGMLSFNVHQFVEVPLAPFPTSSATCDTAIIDTFWHHFVKAVHEWQYELNIPNQASVCPPPIERNKDQLLQPIAEKADTSSRLTKFVKMILPSGNNAQKERDEKFITRVTIDQITTLYEIQNEQPASIVVFAPEVIKQAQLEKNQFVISSELQAHLDWLDNPYKNPAPAKILRYVQRCGNKSYRFLIFQISGYNSTAGHRNSAIVDHENKAIEWFEPNGEFPLFNFMESIVLPALGTLFPGYVQRGAQQVCPLLGPQRLEPYAEKGGFCVCWSLMFQLLRLLNPSWPSEKLIAQMARGGSRDYVGDLVGLKKFNTAFDLMPRFERNPKVLAFIVRSYITRFSKAAEIIAQHYLKEEEKFTLLARGKTEISPQEIKTSQDQLLAIQAKIDSPKQAGFAHHCPRSPLRCKFHKPHQTISSRIFF